MVMINIFSFYFFSFNAFYGTIITDHFSLRPTVACEWEWNELLSCRVTPPFIPKIVSATLISYTTELNLVTACNIPTNAYIMLMLCINSFVIQMRLYTCSRSMCK